MHNLNFRCPHCQKEVEVSLESEAMVLVMTCSHCKTPLMYYYGEAFEVDRMEMGELQQKQLKAVQGFLKVRGMSQPGIAVETLRRRTAGSANHGVGEPVRETAITRDDVLDLLIDLETTHDVDEFLKRLT